MIKRFIPDGWFVVLALFGCASNQPNTRLQTQRPSPTADAPMSDRMALTLDVTLRQDSVEIAGRTIALSDDDALKQAFSQSPTMAYRLHVNDGVTGEQLWRVTQLASDAGLSVAQFPAPDGSYYSVLTGELGPGWPKPHFSLGSVVVQVAADAVLLTKESMAGRIEAPLSLTRAEPRLMNGAVKEFCGGEDACRTIILEVSGDVPAARVKSVLEGIREVASWVVLSFIGETETIRQARTGPRTDVGRLEKRFIQGIIRTNFDEFQACFEHGFARDPNFGGVLSIRFVIEADGDIGAIALYEASISDKTVADCIVSHFEGLRFPSPGGPVTVLYPIRVSR